MRSRYPQRLRTKPVSKSPDEEDLLDESVDQPHFQRSPQDADLISIVSRFKKGLTNSLKADLDRYLSKHGDHASALDLLAQIEEQDGQKRSAASRWRRCLALAPDMTDARFRYARLLFRLGELNTALEQIELLLGQRAADVPALQLKANILGQLGEFHRALAICQQLTTENPGEPEAWLNYGHTLRACGLQDRAIAAYQKALTCRDSYGLAWWALANLKIFRFDTDDIATMEHLLQNPHTTSTDRTHTLFALGKAYEDRQDYARSWNHYAKANAARRLGIDYNADRLTERVVKIKDLLTSKFFEDHAGAGHDASDPIFVLGQPRSGSTLIEQILSSHSAVEGTGELPYIALLSKDFGEEVSSELRADYLGALERITPIALRAVGTRYLEKSGVHRKTNRPFFIDKNPANYLHIGLIQLILPNAKIIDARRNPAACGLSMFKQNFSKNNLRLSEIGRAYRDYVELMTHFDSVLPGKIHRVIYEEMVRDPEFEMRRLLEFCNLSFESNCLRFYESGRAVMTPSSEQVRKPISSDAVDHWRCFEPWLGPLMRSLGSVLTEYPDVPEELH